MKRNDALYYFVPVVIGAIMGAVGLILVWVVW